MPTYYCTDHDSHYVGGASVVIANDRRQAKQLLDEELGKHGLKPWAEHKYTLVLLPDFMAQARVLRDGDY